MRERGPLVGVLLLAGCATRLATLPFVARDAELVGVKLLTPRAEGRVCRVSVLGLTAAPDTPILDEVLAQVFALDPEGNVLTHVELLEERLVTGLYNRRCLRVRGDIGRKVLSVILPTPTEHSTGHENP